MGGWLGSSLILWERGPGWVGREGGQKEREKKDPLKAMHHENLCDKPIPSVISIMLSTPFFFSPLRKTNPSNECVSKLIKDKLSSQQSEHCGDQAHFWQRRDCFVCQTNLSPLWPHPEITVLVEWAYNIKLLTYWRGRCDCCAWGKPEHTLTKAWLLFDKLTRAHFPGDMAVVCQTNQPGHTLTMTSLLCVRLTWAQYWQRHDCCVCQTYMNTLWQWCECCVSD